MSEDARRAVTVVLDAVAADAEPGVGDVMAALGELGVSGAGAEALADHVFRLRADAARLRRRERELAELYSSARELAEIRDASAVLERLVQRAHEMLGGDLTYLSEFDSANSELRVRTTAGSVSALFKSLRVPPGRGLASVVVETRTPQWATRYDEYRSDRHERGIDDAVAAEGIVSLLGVPMLSDDDVLGVLFIAYRDDHDFTPDEVALLSALADHASVVLQTAGMLRTLQSSEDETRAALATLRDHLADRDRASVVHRELVQAVLAGGGYAPVVETLATALERAVAILDERNLLVAAAGLPLSASMSEPGDAVREAIERSRRSARCVTVGADPGVAGVAALTAGPRHFGAIVLGPGRELGAVDLRTVERAAQVGALLALQQEAVADTERRMRTELVVDLLDDVPERRADVARRARRMGIAVDGLETLLLFAVDGEQRAAAARALAGGLGDDALAGEYRGYVIALTSGSGVDPAPLRERLAQATGGAVLAVSADRRAAGLGAAFVEAMRTARLLAALGAHDRVATAREYLPYSAVLDADRDGVDGFLDDLIGPVRRYDAERGTDLLGTLRAFVRSGASPTRTARALRFHANTILQRLERLDVVLGSDWRDDERLFRLGLAVRLDELREGLSRPAADSHG
ncbi:helix-turn-helix domain-containing protein [Microbacterium marinilacus]|uniref:GAF domain-containing protein n=1 Tax=Microbacterium marinilacus TaxID=415209 RepID=A0ABP7BQZ2_9MICO|nr:GAF domain-containing protein [Microbacterium marinilacus]MBY0690264.1 GAF domain-containing protein [Microbacterium marinilacus]